MIKQLEKIPKTGKFSAVWESEGYIYANDFTYLPGGVLAWGCDDEDRGDEVCDETIQAISKSGKFFTLVSEFGKITFEYEWELFKHLRENEDAELCVEPKDDANTVYFSNGSHWACYKNLKDKQVRSLCRDVGLVYQKDWYIKKV